MTEVEQQLTRAVAMHQAGSLAEAERVYRRVLGDEPGNADAANLLGILCCQSKRAEEGLQLLRDAAAAHPAHDGIHYNFANALRESGDLNAAAQQYRASLEIKPDNASAYVNLGATLQDLGRLEEAAEAFTTAIELDGTHIAAKLNLADVLWRLNHRSEAISALRGAIAIDPTCLQAVQYLGTALLVERDYRAAADVWQAAIRMNPTCADYYHNLAQALEGIGELEQAEHAYREAIGRAPGLLPTRHALAQLLARRSATAEAVGSFQAALQLAPADNALRATLLHELADVFHQLEEYEYAFDCYRAANALRGRETNWNARQDEVERTLETFDADSIVHMPRTIRGTDRAVYIVAAPGSETIVRSILARHPDIHDGGATSLLDRAAAIIRESFAPSEPYPQCLNRLLLDDVHEIASGLAQQIDQLCVTRTRIVDISPNNALHLGLANLISPRSRIIWVRRDPVSAGLACFRDPRPFARDLRDVGRHIALTNLLMQHWSTTLSMPILTIDWDDLIADPGAAARQIIDFTGVAWNDRCTPLELGAIAGVNVGPDGYGPFLDPLIETIKTLFQPAHPEAA